MNRVDVKLVRKIIDRMLKPLRTRILMTIARAVVESLKDDGGLQVMKLNVLAGENRDNVERFQNYGFTSHPKPGAESVVIFQGGNREHGLIIAVDDRRFRLKGLAEGEVAIYTDEGDKIHLKRGGLIDVVASTKVTVDAPNVQFKGNVLIDGNLEVKGNTIICGTLLVKLTATINGILSALGFSGLAGAPVAATVDINTSGNVSGGGTDLAAVKSTFNAHTHNENGTGGGVTDAPSVPL